MLFVAMLVDGSKDDVMLAVMKKETTLEQWQIEDAERLRQLFEARLETVAEGKLISQMEFGAKYGIGSQGMVWQYLRARRPLNIKAAVAFARGLGVSVADFSPTLASQIENASEVSQPVAQIQVAEQSEAQTLQWISALEGELLNYFRTYDSEGKSRLLTFARSLVVGAVQRGRTDEA